jgi:thiamine-monophosphate kinase
MPQEFDYIRWVRTQLSESPEVLIGPGDDCALVSGSNSGWLFTTDTITEGVDFLLNSATPEAIGRKAMAVNLSDIAAMGGIPKFALVSVVTRLELGTEFLQRLFAGLHSVAKEFQVSIVGGDTNSWNQGLVVSVVLIGHESKQGAIRRRGAKVGDRIFVTGPCGGSLLGRHLEPKPRIDLAIRLQELARIHAMIDISDGLAADLQHILEESQVGAELIAEKIPIHEDAFVRAAQTGRTPLDHALNDGEDFELLFSVSQNDSDRLLEQPLEGITLCMIGQIIPEGYFIRDEQGEQHPVTPRGWQHQL